MVANGRHSIRERRLVTRRLISSLASVHNTCASTFSLLPPHHVFGSSSCSTERGQTYPAVMEIQKAPLRSSASSITWSRTLPSTIIVACAVFLVVPSTDAQVLTTDSDGRRHAAGV